MQFHRAYREERGHSLLAFVAGVTTTLLVGGYYLFGPQGPENRRGVDRWLRRMKFEILDRLETIEQLTEDQYHRIVDEVTYRQGQLRGLSESKVRYLRERLREQWQEMREAAQRARREAQMEMENESPHTSVRKEETPSNTSYYPE